MASRHGGATPGQAGRRQSQALIVGLLVACALGCFGSHSLAAQEVDRPADPRGDGLAQEEVGEVLAGLEFRNVGPFRQGSWITAIAAPEVDPFGPDREHRHTYYVGARNGGVWKTTNNGVTFDNVTDRYGLAAIGSLAVSISDPEIVWAGTGDAEVARSSYSGTGAWRSEDAGETWQNMGLADSHHVARIVIHPADPDQVWVAVMGHLFSSNLERGVFRTTDGGDTWQHVLDLGPEVGVIDMVIDVNQPNRLWATAYDKVRLPWHLEAGGERSGVYRTDDGGNSWTKLERGLPKGKLGRIGIDRFRNSSPTPKLEADVLYLIVENLNSRPASEEELKAEREGKVKDPQPKVVGNQVYRSSDGGDSWQQVSPEGLSVGSKSAYAFNEIRVDPWNEQNIYILSETLISSVDGGRSYRDVKWPMRTLYSTIFGDVRSMWINPNDPEHILLGSDGGVFPSYDGGRTADHLLNLPLSEVYDVAVDNEVPYNVYAGLQDHEAWRAPINSWSGSVTLEDWVMVGRWDGMVSEISPDGRWYYATTQFGGHLRADLDLGQRTDIIPEAKEGDPEYRFTWTTPLQISPHDPDVIWTGAQKLLRSSDRGTTWEERSPDLTDNDPVRIAGLGHVRFCTITTHAESHLRKGLVWVGTDDGRVWLTRDGGDSWIERTQELVAAGAPRERWVSRVVPSRHQPGRAYVAKSGYRRDDFQPYLWRTDDYGATWVSISGAGGASSTNSTDSTNSTNSTNSTKPLPEAPISVVLEDPTEADLLFVGNDRGVFATLDGGAHWFALGHRTAASKTESTNADERTEPVRPTRASLPTVPVRDLALQEREADLVVGTYGRGAWVGDIRPLREAKAALASGGAHLFEVEAKPLNFTERDEWGAHELYGDAIVTTQNEADGLTIHYWLDQDASRATLRIRRTSDGAVFGEQQVETGSGFHTVRFPFAKKPGEDAEQDSELMSQEEGEQKGDPSEDSQAPTKLSPAEVEVTLEVETAEGGLSTHRQRTRILPNPAQPVSN